MPGMRSWQVLSADGCDNMFALRAWQVYGGKSIVCVHPVHWRQVCRGVRGHLTNYLHILRRWNLLTLVWHHVYSLWCRHVCSFIVISRLHTLPGWNVLVKFGGIDILCLLSVFYWQVFSCCGGDLGSCVGPLSLGGCLLGTLSLGGCCLDPLLLGSAASAPSAASAHPVPTPPVPTPPAPTPPIPTPDVSEPTSSE